MSSVEKSEELQADAVQLLSERMGTSLIDSIELEPRHIWASVRAQMESNNTKHLRGGGTRNNHWNMLEHLLHVFGYGLKLIGLYNRGVDNAMDIQLQSIELAYPHLPEAFDGYTIMHLTDLHLDSLAGLDDKIVSLICDVEVDLCAFTGDYRMEVHGSFHHIMPAMQKVVSAVSAKDGIVATLGNHDTVFMVNPIEAMGVRVLANETLSLERSGETLHITGADDVHYYYTDMVLEAFEAAPDGFKVALVHSPEVYDLAGDHGYDLYLAGHTHGGQISLPGGTPVIRHLSNGRHLASGLWKHGDMIGYTSNGAGTSALPVRFNTRGEVTLFTLRRGQAI